MWHERRTGARRRGHRAMGMFMLSSRRIALGAVLVALTAPPVFAQIDLAGIWRPLARNEDGSGMDGDYAGLPLSEAGRWRAQSWVPENFEVPELVCRPHAFDFSLEAGAARLRWVPEIEDSSQKLVAFHGRLSMREQENTIWMDDRPRPPDYVRHSWSGFNTGVFEGDTLVQTSTHLKEAYIRRWGPMRSDSCDGPVPLETHRQLPASDRDHLRPGLPGRTLYPHIAVLGARPRISCSRRIPAKKRRRRWWSEGARRTRCPARALLPAQDPKLTDAFGTPYEPRLGGPETMYPEYIAKMKTFAAPDRGRRWWGARSVMRHPSRHLVLASVACARVGGIGRTAAQSACVVGMDARQSPRAIDGQIHSVARPRQRLDAGRRRRQHHRACGQRRNPDGRFRCGRRGRQGLGGDPVDFAPAAALHRQHERARGLHRGKRSALA